MDKTSKENVALLHEKMSFMNSDEILELIFMAKGEKYNPTLLKIFKTYLFRALRKEGFL